MRFEASMPLCSVEFRRHFGGKVLGANQACLATGTYAHLLQLADVRRGKRVSAGDSNSASQIAARFSGLSYPLLHIFQTGWTQIAKEIVLSVFEILPFHIDRSGGQRDADVVPLCGRGAREPTVAEVSQIAISPEHKHLFEIQTLLFAKRRT
jgi:hypothetical protein